MRRYFYHADGEICQEAMGLSDKAGVLFYRGEAYNDFGWKRFQLLIGFPKDLFTGAWIDVLPW